VSARRVCLSVREYLEVTGTGREIAGTAGLSSGQVEDSQAVAQCT